MTVKIWYSHNPRVSDAVLTSFCHKEMIKDAIMCSVVTALCHKIVLIMCSGSKYVCCVY